MHMWICVAKHAAEEVIKLYEMQILCLCQIIYAFRAFAAVLFCVHVYF